MEVICLEEEAFYNLFEKVVRHIETTQKKEPFNWIDGAEAMRFHIIWCHLRCAILMY